MAKAYYTKYVEIELSLTEEEAVYLKNILQNSMGHELPNENKCREAIWNALSETLESV